MNTSEEKNNINEKPLITFALFAYNQEKFIREAVEGAFSQTYEPLEIILSDDCSTDNTFNIMQRMADIYKGPHTILLNRNEKRLGLGAHINKVVQMCGGTLIVVAAGDDISLPERTTVIFNLWIKQSCKPCLIYSNIVEISEDGKILHTRDFSKEVTGGLLAEGFSWDYHDRLAYRTPPVHGASFAYQKKIFDYFGPIWEDVYHEDNVLNWRAELIGGIALCPEYLVKHRNHSQQMTNLYSPAALRRANEKRKLLTWSSLQSSRQNIEDSKIALQEGIISEEIYSKACNYFGLFIQKKELEYRLYWGAFTERWKTLFNHWQQIIPDKRLTEILFAVLPRPLYLAMLRLKAYYLQVLT